MRNRNVARLLPSDDICLITNPEAAIALGKSEATFLQQLHYWLTCEGKLGITYEGRRWVYNTYKDWAENIRIYSESTIRRAISKLEKLGILLTENLNKKRSDHTKWYSINYEALKQILPSASSKKKERVGGVKIDECLLKTSSPSIQKEQNIIKENKDNFRKEKQSITQILRKNETSQRIPKKSSFTSHNNFLDEMIFIWNKTVEEGKRIIELNKKRKCFLKVAFETKFDSCLEKWKEFCKKIASSKFLMGEIKSSFKASLDWVLKFDILQRIVEGDYGVGDRTVALQQEVISISVLQKEIQNSNEDEVIKRIRLDLLTRLEQPIYLSWFRDIAIRINDSNLIFVCLSNFVKDYVERNFLRDIKQTISSVLGNATLKIISTE